MFATLGDNCIDRYLPPLDHCLVGGNALNVAVQLAELGREVHYFGAVGGDRAGQWVRESLSSRGVGMGHLITLAALPTAATGIAVAANGERQFIAEDFGACAAYAPTDGDLAVLRAMRHVHIGWLNDGGAAKQALAGSGPAISQDLSVNNTLENLDPQGLDIAFCSSAAEDGEAQLRRLLDAGARMAVVTLGAAGSLAGTADRRWMAPAPEIRPVDTTGAGDAFIAGFIAAHAEGREIDACLHLATERAGRACQHRGGFRQAPIAGLLTEK